ncbi:MAG TPA: YegS/Rv2252/BmrU family lipid kinase [Thermoanaerobaculia bacterium]|nr:YegS/Rv2252/BmrU family lipid kinase [Thermoanaerobaculia bacterium]
MRHAVLIWNPAAGRRRQRRQLAAALPVLAAGGVAVEAVPTAGPGDATRLARRAAADGADLVVALGGDGTVREVAAGLLGGEVPLAILPGGTTNVLAQALGLPADPRSAARLAARLDPRPLDVGRCGGAPFLMMASAGLDSLVLARLDPRLKRWFGRPGILAQGLAELARYSWPALELSADGEVVEASFAAICNIPFYGGAFPLAPGACCDDRRFDLVTFRGRGMASALAFAAALVRGTHLGRPDVALRRVEEVVLTGPSGAELQIDGDSCSVDLPVTVGFEPRPLAVIAPPSAALPGPPR